jgi:RecB family endonuclease NucS
MTIHRSGKAFLKKLNEIGIVDMKKVESYFLVPEYTWLLSYIENPDWLKQRLESFVKREEEYQRYIRDNISLVEEGLILVSEQYQLDSGRIDIVCRDVNGKDVGLELKYPSASNEVLGQIMRYREDYKRLTTDGNTRFLLIAPTIPEKLKGLLAQNSIEYREIPF